MFDRYERQRIDGIAFRVLCFWAGLLLCVSMAHCQMVERVIDGDTIDLVDGKRVKLHGVDAPELEQLGGGDAKLLAEKLLLGKTVTLVDEKQGAWGRVEAKVRIGKYDWGATLINRGYGYVDERHCDRPLATTYKNLQLIAKQSKVGVWADRVDPWDWQSERRPAATESGALRPLNRTPSPRSYTPPPPPISNGTFCPPGQT